MVFCLSSYSGTALSMLSSPLSAKKPSVQELTHLLLSVQVADRRLQVGMLVGLKGQIQIPPLTSADV